MNLKPTTAKITAVRSLSSSRWRPLAVDMFID